MARLVTLAELRDEARRRADMVGDNGFISDDVLTSWINKSIATLYDIILTTEQGEVFQINSPILTQVGDNAYLLRADFYKLVSVHSYIGGEYYRATKGQTDEFATLRSHPPSEYEPRYFIKFDAATGDKHLQVFPAPNPDYLAVVYIPYAPVLSDDDDTWDGFNGWEEWVILDVAIKMLDKEESDSTALRASKEAEERLIKAHSAHFDAGMPMTIKRVRHLRRRWPR